MRTASRAPLALGWIASQLHWIAHTDNESIYVDAVTYHRCLKEFLASQGIEWKTWTQYMSPAEAAWVRQCRAEKRLQADLDFWRSVPGVQIVQKKQAKTTTR